MIQQIFGPSHKIFSLSLQDKSVKISEKVSLQALKNLSYDLNDREKQFKKDFLISQQAFLKRELPKISSLMTLKAEQLALSEMISEVKEMINLLEIKKIDDPDFSQKALSQQGLSFIEEDELKLLKTKLESLDKRNLRIIRDIKHLKGESELNLDNENCDRQNDLKTADMYYYDIYRVFVLKNKDELNVLEKIEITGLRLKYNVDLRQNNFKTSSALIEEKIYGYLNKLIEKLSRPIEEAYLKVFQNCISAIDERLEKKKHLFK